MQIRELSPSELDAGYTLLRSLRLELTPDQFDSFITSQFPKDYRPIGAYERGDLRIYAGVAIRENLEIGRHLLINDFVADSGYEHLSKEVIDFLRDYAKMHGCREIIIFGKQRGLSIDDLEGFRPRRDGYWRAV